VPASIDTWQFTINIAITLLLRTMEVQVSFIKILGFCTIRVEVVPCVKESQTFRTTVSFGLSEARPPSGSLGAPVVNWMNARCSCLPNSRKIARNCSDPLLMN
jgi:hypothetical protein